MCLKTKLPISRLEGYIDGYERGKADGIDEFVSRLTKLSVYARPVGWSKKEEIILMQTILEVAADLRKEGF